jgi:putative transposase
MNNIDKKCSKQQSWPVRKSHRSQQWNYGNAGYYFITICTANRKNHFGKIINGTMLLNDIGKIAGDYWLEIPKHFSNILLDKYIFMPDHLHGIIHIVNSTDAAAQRPYIINSADVAVQRPYEQNNIKMSNISPKSGTLSVIIRSFKSIVTKTVNAAYPNTNFSWQSRFYDHIIRSEGSLNKIRQYIADNPIKWDIDEYNPINISKGE